MKRLALNLTIACFVLSGVAVATNLFAVYTCKLVSTRIKRRVNELDKFSVSRKPQTVVHAQRGENLRG